MARPIRRCRPRRRRDAAPHRRAVVVGALASALAAAGGGEARGEPLAPPAWEVTVTAALVARPDDAYTRRLELFGYRPGELRDALALAMRRRLHRAITAGVRLTRLDGERWSRDTELEPLQLTVVSHAATAIVRAQASAPRVTAWVEAGVGATWARTRFEDEEGQVAFDDHAGAHLVAGVGLSLTPAWLGAGAVELSLHRLRAPTVDNAITPAPDTLDVGGVVVGLGLAYRPR